MQCVVGGIGAAQSAARSGHRKWLVAAHVFVGIGGRQTCRTQTNGVSCEDTCQGRATQIQACACGRVVNFARLTKAGKAQWCRRDVGTDACNLLQCVVRGVRTAQGAGARHSDGLRSPHILVCKSTCNTGCGNRNGIPYHQTCQCDVSCSQSGYIGCVVASTDTGQAGQRQGRRRDGTSDGQGAGHFVVASIRARQCGWRRCDDDRFGTAYIFGVITGQHARGIQGEGIAAQNACKRHRTGVHGGIGGAVIHLGGRTRARQSQWCRRDGARKTRQV